MSGSTIETASTAAGVGLAPAGAATTTAGIGGSEPPIRRLESRARTAAGDRDVSIAGGASTIRQYLRAGLPDELEIHLVPVLFGDGVRLFDRSGERIEFEPAGASESSGVTHLEFRLD